MIRQVLPAISDSSRSMRCGARAGFTYLELQVAFALFALALTGVGPLVAMYARQTTELERRLKSDNIHYLTPSDNEWATKLGAVANFSDELPDEPAYESVTVVDNASADFAFDELGGHDMYAVWSWNAYGHWSYWNQANADGDRMIWTFGDVRPGYYRVFVTYPTWHFNARNAPFEVYDGTALQGSVRVNQRTAPTGAAYDGRTWDSLGTYSVTSGEIQVVLTDDADDGFVVADAVRIEAVTNDISIQAVDKAIDSDTVTITVFVQENVP